MNVHTLVRDRIVGALKALEGEGALPPELDLGSVDVAPPRDAAHGDLASNAALVLAKAARMKSRDIAERVAERLRGDADIETVKVAGAGFLNLRFAPRFWHGVLAAILREGSAYGRTNLGRGERVNVAYVLADFAAPMHVGHCRGAVLGDALTRLLAFVGYDVTCECFINDAAAQVDMLAVLKGDLAALNIRHDLVVSERSLTAYHRNRLARGFKNLISVLGHDHAADPARMKAAVAALSGRTADVDIKVCQPLKLLRAGERVRVSKRAGGSVALRDVVDEVGRDAVRFMMLYRKHDAPLDFDLARVLEQSKDNPVFHVQYAHARAKSVFRNARELFPSFEERAAEVVNSDLSLLSDAGEIDLIKRLALLPGLVESVARAREPHRLAFYLYDLASSFHGQLARGHDLPHLRSIQPSDGTLTAARLALVQANAQVLAVGLELLGVLAPLEMR